MSQNGTTNGNGSLQSPPEHDLTLEPGDRPLPRSRTNGAVAGTSTSTRVRPMAGGVSSDGSSPADALSALYNPQGPDFVYPLADWSGLYYAPVRTREGAYLDPPRPHRMQVVERDSGGKYSTREVLCPTGRSLAELAASPEYRRSRLFEATGMWNNRLDPDAYRRLVQEAADPRVLGGARLGQPPSLFDADTGKRMRVLEHSSFEYGDTAYDSSGVTGEIDKYEFIPIMGGPYHRQLYLYAHWDSVAKAFYEKNHSELAKNAIQITSDFTLGRGVTWKIKHGPARRVWEEFWDRNNMDFRIRQLSDDLTWQGELLIRKQETLPGFLTIRSMDPGSIHEIITVPEDVEQVLYYHAQYPTQWQMPYSQFKGQQHNVPIMRYVLTQYAANEIYHVKMNVSSTEKWGRSDFYCAFGTLKRHRDWVNAATLKDMLQSNLIWKIKVHGDDADVQAFISDENNQKLPGFGGTWVENDAIELSPVHADVSPSQRAASGNTGDFLTALFATSQQMPTSYFNVTQGGTRAQALTQAEPFVKKIATRQQVFRAMLDHLYESVMRLAVKVGRITAAEVRHEDSDPEWVFPSPYEEDRGAKFRDLVTAKGMATISHRSMSVAMAQELGLAEYDYSSEMEEIEQESQNPLLKLWPPHGGGSASAIQGSFPSSPIPPNMGGGGPGGPPGMPGMPPGMMPGMPPELAGALPGAGENPMDKPQNVEGRAEGIKGADEKEKLRLSLKDRPSVGVRESLFGRITEAAIEAGFRGELNLPGAKVNIDQPAPKEDSLLTIARQLDRQDEIVTNVCRVDDMSYVCLGTTPADPGTLKLNTARKARRLYQLDAILFNHHPQGDQRLYLLCAPDPDAFSIERVLNKQDLEAVVFFPVEEAGGRQWRRALVLGGGADAPMLAALAHYQEIDPRAVALFIRGNFSRLGDNMRNSRAKARRSYDRIIDQRVRAAAAYRQRDAESSTRNRERSGGDDQSAAVSSDSGKPSRRASAKEAVGDDWEEAEHPRAEDGKFTSKGGGAAGPAKDRDAAPQTEKDDPNPADLTSRSTYKPGEPRLYPNRLFPLTGQPSPENPFPNPNYENLDFKPVNDVGAKWVDTLAADDYGNATFENMVSRMDNMVALARNEMSPQEFRDARKWYQLRFDEMREYANKDGIGLPQMTVAGVTAAMSPRMEWEDSKNGFPGNWTLAQRMIEWHLKKADKPVEITERALTFFENNQPYFQKRFPGITFTELMKGRKIGQKVTPARLAPEAAALLIPFRAPNGGTSATAAAIRILRGDSPDYALSGLKVRNFYNNLMRPDDDRYDDATVDTHMMRLLMNKPTLEMLSPQVSKIGGSRYGYELMRHAIVAAARKHHMRPSEMQALCWTMWKLKYEKIGGFRELKKTLTRSKKEGKLTRPPKWREEWDDYGYPKGELPSTDIPDPWRDYKTED